MSVLLGVLMTARHTKKSSDTQEEDEKMTTEATSIAAQLWTQAQPRALQCLYHPFVSALAAGTLARADFEAFLLQDAYYLHGFAKAFAHAVVKAKDTKHALAVIRLMGGIEVELSNHTAFLQVSRAVRPCGPLFAFVRVLTLYGCSRTASTYSP